MERGQPNMDWTSIDSGQLQLEAYQAAVVSPVPFWPGLAIEVKSSENGYFESDFTASMTPAANELIYSALLVVWSSFLETDFNNEFSVNSCIWDCLKDDQRPASWE
jgi:hypothetical protein